MIHACRSANPIVTNKIFAKPKDQSDWAAPGAADDVAAGWPPAQVWELVDAGQVSDLARLTAEAGAQPLAWPVPLGGGSNVLVADQGIAAPVVLVRTCGVTYRRPHPGGPLLVTAQGGHPWQDLAWELAAENLVHAVQQPR